MFGIPNPQFLLQPWRNLTQFTEELFASVTSREPVEREGPVTIRVREGETALRIVRGGDDAREPAQKPRQKPVSEPLKWAVSPSADRARAQEQRFKAPSFPSEPSSARRQPDPIVQPPLPAQPPLQPPAPVAWQDPPSSQPLHPPLPTPERQAPLVSIEGPVEFTGPEPVRFEFPPQVFDPERRRYVTPKAWEPPDMPGFTSAPAGGGGTTVFIGKVLSGGGSSYQVTLYQNGPDGDPDSSAVTVTIPMIADGETINPGTWLYGIFQFSDADGNDIYSCQPPVWM